MTTAFSHFDRLCIGLPALASVRQETLVPISVPAHGKDGRSRRDASPTGTTKTTKTTTTASKWIDPTTVAAPATSLSRASGRTRKQVQKFSFIQEPELQLRLIDQLNELCVTDIGVGGWVVRKFSSRPALESSRSTLSSHRSFLI